MIADDREPEGPVDLSPLDPRGDAAMERAVAAIMSRAAPVLARHANGGVIELFASWTRPLLLAASLVGIASVGALARYGTGASGSAIGESGVSLDASVAQAIGVPATLATWAAGGATPTPGQLIEGNATSAQGGAR